jgi:hypothetical protein
LHFLFIIYFYFLDIYILFIKLTNFKNIIYKIQYKHMGIGDWGLGVGDWGLGIGPNPQSPIPNPQIMHKI